MGSILQERVPQQCLERVSIRDREWKKKAPWINNRPNVPSNKMGRRQSQRKSLQPQYPLPSQENNNEKRLQQRRKQKPHNPSTKHVTSQHSAQGTSESKSQPLSPAEDRMEPKVQPAAQHCHSHREHKHTGFRGSRHTPAFPCHHLSDPSPDLQERLSPQPEVGSLSGHGEDDSDTDLSESERLPVSLSGRVPAQLQLRPEVIQAEDCSSGSHRSRGHGHACFDFPDFLPPPFNNWNLSQLAHFYNMEGRGAPRPRPVGPLERYLERLLQLEWCQIQTVQEEGEKSAVPDVSSSCHRPLAAVSSRLSSPKCILQCQRAFPLTFLSSLASHSALLSGCACTLCRIRYSTCSTSCCRSTHHTRQSRQSPMLERKGPTSLPKRSYSESRVHFSERSSASRAQVFSSPVRTNSHQRRMQASGNIRNPVQGANTTAHPTARDSSVGARRDCLGVWPDVLDYRTGGFRRRSGSEQRRGGLERQQGSSGKRRSGSECRRGGAERTRKAELKEREIKPDAVAAIMDNLPGSKNPPINRPGRQKQVEFVT
ncbi:uncharacterized protein LOC131968596 [Centropristis striata]|uniref:uncharacterized protein LOC131968596 n=1 Tax=Centropristis striata TaxID=184440 RepID=UPI0027DECB3D|nr:uncharacterized protein LOC131968596 [Centropristis striata]